MKNRFVAIFLAFFLGSIGIHQFYLGHNILGILYLIFSWTFIPLIISLFDFVGLLLTSDSTFNKKYNGLPGGRLDVAILEVCSKRYDGATVSECIIATQADPHQVKETIDQLVKKGLLASDNRLVDQAVVYKAI
jgi:TM2 domain-containing membrane protein YozV